MSVLRIVSTRKDDLLEPLSDGIESKSPNPNQIRLGHVSEILFCYDTCQLTLYISIKLYYGLCAYISKALISIPEKLSSLMSFGHSISSSSSLSAAPLGKAFTTSQLLQ